MSFNFCPNCGTPLEIFNAPFEPQKCEQCGQTQYHSSTPCAGALIVQDNRVLLVKRGIEPYKGCWDIPGGFLEPGEHLLDGMLREVREETGLDVRVVELLGVYMDQYDTVDGRHIHTLNLYYIVEQTGGMLQAGDDAVAFEWFPLDRLPAESEIAFEHAKRVLNDLQKKLT